MAFIAQAMDRRLERVSKMEWLIVAAPSAMRKLLYRSHEPSVSHGPIRCALAFR